MSEAGLLAAACAGYYLVAGMAICIGYHRVLSHRSAVLAKWLERTLVTLGLPAGTPMQWAGNHRFHHAHADQPGDPHSPRDGAWWSHVGWILFGESNHSNTRVMGKYAPDLMKHPFYVWLNNWHWVPLTVLGIALLAFGGWSVFLWGSCVRIVFGLHATWLVNSATHLWGSRRFDTRDDSRNSWWVALLTFGEGWHNNHHAHPTSARHGLAWYEFDISWIQIKVLKFFGIAKAIRVASVNSTSSAREAA